MNENNSVKIPYLQRKKIVVPPTAAEFGLGIASLVMASAITLFSVPIILSVGIIYGGNAVALVFLPFAMIAAIFGFVGRRSALGVAGMALSIIALTEIFGSIGYFTYEKHCLELVRVEDEKEERRRASELATQINAESERRQNENTIQRSNREQELNAERLRQQHEETARKSEQELKRLDIQKIEATNAVKLERLRQENERQEPRKTPESIMMQITQALPVGTHDKLKEKYASLVYKRSQNGKHLASDDCDELKELFNATSWSFPMLEMEKSEYGKSVTDWRQKIRKETGSFPIDLKLFELEYGYLILEKYDDWHGILKYSKILEEHWNTPLKDGQKHISTTKLSSYMNDRNAFDWYGKQLESKEVSAKIEDIKPKAIVVDADTERQENQWKEQERKDELSAIERARTEKADNDRRDNEIKIIREQNQQRQADAFQAREAQDERDRQNALNKTIRELEQKARNSPNDTSFAFEIDRLKRVDALRVRAAAQEKEKIEKQVAQTPDQKINDTPPIVYLLKDGTEIKAKTAVTTDTDYVIKDTDGKFKTIKKSDVEEIRTPPKAK